MLRLVTEVPKTEASLGCDMATQYREKVLVLKPKP